jgi:hypothetical protein
LRSSPPIPARTPRAPPSARRPEAPSPATSTVPSTVPSEVSVPSGDRGAPAGRPRPRPPRRRRFRLAPVPGSPPPTSSVAGRPLSPPLDAPFPPSDADRAPPPPPFPPSGADRAPSSPPSGAAVGLATRGVPTGDACSADDVAGVAAPRSAAGALGAAGGVGVVDVRWTAGTPPGVPSGVDDSFIRIPCGLVARRLGHRPAPSGALASSATAGSARTGAQRAHAGATTRGEGRWKGRLAREMHTCALGRS